MLEIVIPAYNEETRLGPTLASLRTFVTTDSTLLAYGAVKVIVVDNASTDATSTVARAADSRELPVRVVHCATRGKGAATRAGVAQTNGDVVAFMDADGATDFRALETGIALVTTGADLAIGSRAVEGADVSARHTAARVHGAALFRSMATAIVPGVSDTQCGLKVMRGEVARALFRAGRIRGFSFDVELLALAQQRLLSIAEFPVRWVDMPGSTFRPAVHGVSSFIDLALVRWRLRASIRPRRLALPAVPVAAPVLPAPPATTVLASLVPVAIPAQAVGALAVPVEV